ncbi:MAG: SRPBCC domain-containing protein [Xanthobacteraceae bacterium]|nr:SRPBCC domain-containing protein [Xanthobacteraceae bacterium]
MPIHWPERYAPDRVAVRVSNEITVAAEPAAVWAWLIRASLWPTWYPNSHRVAIEGGAADLSAGARFTWRTFGVAVRSTVREFVAQERIAWGGAGLMMDVYHAWLIEPRPAGCRVLTEEHQNGLGPRLQAALMPRRMFEGHELWLARLKANAEGGCLPA